MNKNKKKMKDRKAKINQITFSNDMIALQALLNSQFLSSDQIHTIKQIFFHKPIAFISEVQTMMNESEFQAFIHNAKVIRKQENQFIINKHNETKSMFILLEGYAVYQLQTYQKNNRVTVQVDEVVNGSLLTSFQFFSSKALSYDVKCFTNCILIQVFNQNELKILWKMMEKKILQMSTFLSMTAIFSQLSKQKISMLVPLFISQEYRVVNNLLPMNEYLQLIVEGQLQISKKTFIHGRKQYVRIIKLSKGQWINLKTIDSLSQIRLKTPKLKVLKLNQKIFEAVICPILQRKIQTMETQKRKNYTSLYERNKKSLNRIQKYHSSKLRKNLTFQKKKTKEKIDLWGIQQIIKNADKNTLNSLYFSEHNQNKTQGPFLGAKIYSLKRQLFQRQMSEIESQKQQQTTYSHSQWRKSRPTKTSFPVKIYTQNQGKLLSRQLTQKVKKKLIHFMKNQSLEDKIMI